MDLNNIRAFLLIGSLLLGKTTVVNDVRSVIYIDKQKIWQQVKITSKSEVI